MSVEKKLKHAHFESTLEKNKTSQPNPKESYTQNIQLLLLLWEWLRISSQ